MKAKALKVGDRRRSKDGQRAYVRAIKGGSVQFSTAPTAKWPWMPLADFLAAYPDVAEAPKRSHPKPKNSLTGRAAVFAESDLRRVLKHQIERLRIHAHRWKISAGHANSKKKNAEPKLRIARAFDDAADLLEARLFRDFAGRKDDDR